ncbi:hypothetical protein E4U52_003350 [Claviceps spartinae]|nr:hypothetical protein E4U52_003350 [Claviceps spartinae]
MSTFEAASSEDGRRPRIGYSRTRFHGSNLLVKMSFTSSLATPAISRATSMTRGVLVVLAVARASSGIGGDASSLRSVALRIRFRDYRVKARHGLVLELVGDFLLRQSPKLGKALGPGGLRGNSCEGSHDD